MTADGIDTQHLRARGPYITSMASDGYPSICVDTDSWDAMCNEIDRLRAALAFHTANQVRTHRDGTDGRAARDPHCGLSHPHSRTTQCAGD